ncbi:Predicted SnoaL-like aldol condensation-catalyzing enzyme [Amycolatopsis tolypomycina]|uniref:Predicted SnoaL-like aldol condensation-catalyzing enzyme n=1 Tax=Amycolatopsis tolypomycina TaxID=208445 RepID=A0A1H4IK47_9PSEU|nr:nuclear transport factor 2 family protein [Amycolatopsis tolypomycina]SEB33632.1 Predicted SnoaL-like aldol condensation-catalyzing enzyme [Amycolatopsis tolypomycina]
MTESQRNKEVVLAFLRLAFTEKRPADAFAAHVGDGYVQHNPHAPAGAAASARYLAGFVARFPELSLDVHRVIAEDDLVCTHGLLRLTPGSRGSAVADVMRVRDGRIVEHWDVVQEVPEVTVSGNPMV